MPVQFNEENEGKLIVIRVSGKLEKADYDQFVPVAEQLMQKHGKVSMLFEMVDFHGWEVSALWEDTKFGFKHYHDVEKLAIVGDKQWEKSMATFCKPFTKAIVRYFDHADLAEAREWLNAA